MPIRRDQLATLLKDRAFRAQFVSDQPGGFLPIQIRRLRERRGWTQAELAERVGTQQVVVSRWESPDNPGITLNTLKRLAQAFDVAFIVRFAPFSEFIDWVCTLSTSSFEPASFDEESSARRYEPVGGASVQGALSLWNDDPYATVSNIYPLEPRRIRREESSSTRIQISTPEGASRYAAS